MKRIYILLLLFTISNIFFGQTETSKHTLNDNFENILRDIIVYINDGKIDSFSDDQGLIQITEEYSFKKFDFEKFNQESIRVPIKIKGTKIDVKSKFLGSISPSDIELVLERKKKTSGPPAAPISEIPLENYLSEWVIILTKKSSNSCVLEIEFKGVSKEMTAEINNYIVTNASNQFVIKKFDSSKILEKSLLESIIKSKNKRLFPQEIGPEIKM